MNITFQSVIEFGIAESAALCTNGFSDYFVPIQISAAGLLGMVRQDSVDLSMSRVILADDTPVGVALIARRGWTSRLAAMSVIPEGRGRGSGEAAVKQLFAEAQARGDTAMTLEVIEQNTPAVRLYEKCGFEKLRRLIGFNGPIPAGASNTHIEQIDVREAARALIAYGPDDLPWQISGETLAQAGLPTVAYESDSAYLVLTDPSAPKIAIRAIVTRPDARRRGHASALLQAVSAFYPDKVWRVSPTFPEEIGGLFSKLGMDRDSLSQWQMLVQI